MDKKQQLTVADVKPGMFVEIVDSPTGPRTAGRIDTIASDGAMPLASITLLDGRSTSWYLYPKASITLLEPFDVEKARKTTWPATMSSARVGPNGADPEVFVLNRKNQLIPAWEFLPKKGGHSVYWDGFQAEFQVMASGCLDEQNRYTRSGLKAVYNAACKIDEKAKLSPLSTMEIPVEVLIKASDEHVALGCKPSLNAYGMSGDIPVDPRLLTHRFTGGHIHKQIAGLLEPRARGIVKAIDAIATVPTITMFQNLDNPIRRRFYGLPGEYRLPKHGLEYRTLSSAWLCHPCIAQFTRELVRAAFGMGNAEIANVFEFDEKEVVATIMTGDVDAAKKHVEKNKEQYKLLLNQVYYDTKAVKAGMKLLVSPVEEFVKPLAMVDNWNLKGDSWGGPSQWRMFAQKC